MNKLLHRLIGRSAKTKAAMKALTGTRNRHDNPDTRDSRDNPVTIEDGSENAMRRQLVQVLLRDVIRRHGIPPQLIELQMLVVSSASRGSGLYVRLVIRQWDTRLMKYAQAFQNELMTDIARFEPLASQWLHGISWQLEMSATCPYTTLPDKAFWFGPVTQASPQKPTLRAAPENETKEDLERLFFIRDQEISRTAGSHAPVGYEKTQPSPL